MKLALFGRGKMGKAILEIADVVEIEDADVCIDVSAAEAVLTHVEKACQAKKNLVIGTTGWDDLVPQVRDKVERAGIGALYCPNFSLGVRAFFALAEQARALLKGYRVTGVEMHCASKADKPSGTARHLEGKIGVEFACVRSSGLLPVHTVIFHSGADSVELTHRANSRESYAKGALEMAEWIRGKQGFFTMNEVAT